jgi:starch phosphorylase
MATKATSQTEITELVNGLNKMARNLWWTWDQEAQELFQELSPRSWQNLYHNAVAILHEVSDYELRVRLQDKEFASHVRNVLPRF